MDFGKPRRNSTSKSSIFRRAAISSKVICTIRFRRRSKNASRRALRLSALSATPDICRRTRFFRPLRRLRQSPSAVSTIIIRSIAPNAECIVQVTVRRSTVFKNRKSSRRRFGFPRRFCRTRRPPSKPTLLENLDKAEDAEFARNYSKQIRS